MSKKKLFETIQIHTVSDLRQKNLTKFQNLINENAHFHLKCVFLTPGVNNQKS